MNNLAVLRITGPREARDPDAGRDLLDRAAARGHLVAGYNLARMAENRDDTPIEEVARVLALLEPAVAAGDPHAAAQMADVLYFRSREALVPDRAERRRALRRQAAASGDPVYLYRFGRELWDNAGLDDTDLALEAIAVMERAAQAGERRAMLFMGQMERDRTRALRAAMPGGFPGGDRFDWWARAADAGSLAGACLFAVNFFRDEGRRETAPVVHTGLRPAPDGRTRMALSHLATCAEARRPPAIPNPVFGAPALRYGRPVGGVMSLNTSPATARTILAVLLLEGRLLAPDAARARALLESAAPDNRFAATLLASLGD
jgi:TPR repeat protein